MLSQYADIFGAPRTGVHSYRVFDIAIVDVLATIGGSYLLARWQNWSFPLTVAGMMIASYPLHKLFGVKTKTTEEPWYLLILALPPYPI